MSSLSTKVLGTVAMEPKGEYSAEAYYEKLNTVLYNDSTYMAIKPSHNILPTDTEYWQLIGGGAKKEEIVQVFDTVADMKLADLKDGMSVQTLGYYSVNDGGGATYKITNVESEIDYQEELENGLYATLVINDSANVGQFGAKGNGIDDDYEYISNCLKYVKNKPIYFDNKTYLISDTLSIDNNILKGNKSVFKATNLLDDKYMSIPHNKVEIDDITFDCDSNAIGCINISSDNNYLNINNCIFKNAKRYLNENNFSLNSVVFLCAKDVIFKNSKVINNIAQGLHLNAKSEHTNMIIENSEFSNNGINGETISSGLVSYHRFDGELYDKVIIKDCIANNNANGGIATNAVNNVVIDNCIANNNGEHGIVLMDGKNAKISNCTCKYTDGYGIRIQGDYTSLDEITGYKNFIISNNYLVGNGIDIDYYISNGIIENNIIEYAPSLTSEVPRGIRIGKLNHAGDKDIIENISFINNKITGYTDKIYFIQSFVQVKNSCIFDNFFNGIRVKGYKTSQLYEINCLNDIKYNENSDNKIPFPSDFTQWTIPSNVTLNNNVFTAQTAAGLHLLVYKNITFTTLPKFISILSNFEKVNSEDNLYISLGLRFRGTNGIITNGTITDYVYTLNTNMNRIYDISKINVDLSNATSVDVIIGIKDLQSVKINNCYCAFSNKQPIIPNGI